MMSDSTMGFQGQVQAQGSIPQQVIIIADDESVTESEISCKMTASAKSTSCETRDYHWDDDQRRALEASYRRTMEELDKPIYKLHRDATDIHPLMMASREEIEAQAKERNKQGAKQEPLKRGFIWQFIEQWFPKFLLIKMQPKEGVQAPPRNSPGQVPRFFKNLEIKPPAFRNPFRPRANTSPFEQATPSRSANSPGVSRKRTSWLMDRFKKPQPSVEDNQRNALQQAHYLRDSCHDFQDSFAGSNDATY